MNTRDHSRTIGGTPVLLLAVLAAGGWGGPPLPPAPDGQAVLLGHAHDSPPYMFLPLACWSRRSGFESGPACDGIVPVGALFTQKKSARQVRVQATEPWSCPLKSNGAPPAGQGRTALRLARGEWSHFQYRDPAAWPPAVAATIVDWFESDVDDSPSATQARAARLALLARAAAKILPPDDGWKPDRETAFDVDGDGRPERFLRAHREVRSKQGDDCASVESALAVSWGGRWVKPRSPDIDPNWPGGWHADGGEPPVLLGQQIGPAMSIAAAVDLDRDGRHELVVGGWSNEPCRRGQGRWALLRLERGTAQVLARWDECGRSLGPPPPPSRDAK